MTTTVKGNPMPQPPAQYNDTLLGFNPDEDYSAVLASKDIHSQRLVKTLSLRTYERDVERQAREELTKQLNTQAMRIAELEAALAAKIDQPKQEAQIA